MTGGLTTRTTSAGKEYFYVVLHYIDPVSKKRATNTVKTGLTVKNNKQKAKHMIPEIIDKYQYLEDEQPESFSVDPDITLCEYLDIWLEDKKSSIRTDTYEGYLYRVGKIKKYFLPTNPKLVDVTPKLMDIFFKYSLLYGKVNQRTGERGPLSVRSVRSYKSVLNAVFNQARIDGLLRDNPVNGVPVTNKKNADFREEYLFLTEDEITEVLSFLSLHYPFLFPIAFFGIYYGLRRSEIIGLKWDAIDYKKLLITIQHTVVRVRTRVAEDHVKTRNSSRSLSLFPTAQKLLEQIRQKQLEDIAFYGNTYKNTDGYVFCWEDGHTYDPNYITREFKKAMAKYGRPEITLHKLRHTCASILIDRGLDIKKIQYWMGHEDIQTTLDIYAHYMRSKSNQEGNEMELLSESIRNLIG